MSRIRGISRRVLPAALALTSVVACSLSLPMPVAVSKPGGKPFPCQNHACGCPDAESCWRHCCCFTAQEKLAWARSHGVAPPKFAIVAAEREAHDQAAGCGHSCCLAAAHHDHETNHTAASAPVRRTSRSVMLIMALKCRGVHVSVTLMPPSLPVERGGFSEQWVEFFPAPTPAPLLYDSPHLAVATPPPDFAEA